VIQLLRTYRFCASHVLARPGWSREENERLFGSAAHPSGHGHNYRLTIVLEGEPDADTGRLVDFEALDAEVDERVIRVYDHRNMNLDVPSLAGRVPTLEVVLEDLWKRLADMPFAARLVEIRLRQDEITEAVFHGSRGADLV